MGQYLASIWAREKPLSGVLNRLVLPSSNAAERAKIEDMVSVAVGGRASLYSSRYINAIRLFSRDEVETVFVVDTSLSQQETLDAVASAVQRYWGNNAEVYYKKIEQKNIFQDVVGDITFRGVLAAFAGAFMLGAVLGVVVKMFKG